MSIHLVLPGLVWPAARTPALTAGLALPALEALLGHARVRNAPAEAADAWLMRAFGVSGDRLPVAPLRRMGEPDAAEAPGEWLCADPVHLHFSREHLLLTDASALAITGEEAAALVSSLNDYLDEVEPGLGRFEAGAPDRWYLRLAAPARASFHALGEVVGRPVKHFLPEGEAARTWHRLINEVQVILHNHPVNRAREAAGRRPVNSIWPWGGGALPGKLGVPARAVQAESAMARGLARAAGLPLAAPAPVPAEGTLVVLDPLLAPTLHLDLDAWREALAALEAEWFAPLLAALKARRLPGLRISAPGDRATLELDCTTRDLWKFWHRPRTLDSLIAPLP